MKIFPANLTENANPAVLREFLEQCVVLAREAGRPRLVSISVAVENLDPLGVLESIFEPSERHFYAERSTQGFAVAGAKVALDYEVQGSNRFIAARDFIVATLADAIAVGPLDEPFSGPHFFVAGGFFDTAAADAPFVPLQLFVPRWQVSCCGDSSVAVANFPVSVDAPLELIAAEVRKAYVKLKTFDYSAVSASRRPFVPCEVVDLGGAGAYHRAVTRGLERIAAGEFEKIVLAWAKQITRVEVFNPLAILNHVRKRYASCCSFLVSNARGQSFIGASPERLVRVAQGRLHTEALAGSAPRGESASEDAVLARALLQDEKELSEHRFVLQSLCDSLADLDLVLEYPVQPRILGLANVQHLYTPVSAALPAGVHVLDLVQRLHPTSAVGGTPRCKAVPAIRELETFSRGLYTGPIGWVNSRGKGEFFVGLRSALIEGNYATVFAGAGIVAGSTPEKEFAETELKFKALIEAFTITL